jgi:hypothetical protein
MGHQQSFFLMTCSAAKVFRGVLIGAVIVTSSLLSITCRAESDNKVLSLRANVVRVWADGNSENGFGFIIAVRAESIYVITAYHLVAANDPNFASPCRFRCILYRRGQRFQSK